MTTLAESQTPPAGSASRLLHLFRLEAPRWIKASLAIILIPLVLAAGFRLFVSLLLWLGANVEINAQGIPATPKIYAGIWLLSSFLAFPFFISGVFSDLGRPGNRAFWLLLPAHLWEKLIVRWLCSTVIFIGINLLVGTVLLWLVAVVQAGRPEEFSSVMSKVLEHLKMAKTWIAIGSVHAIFFFFSAIFRNRVSAMAWGLGVLFILLLLGRANPSLLGQMLFSSLLLLPGTWLVMKWSRV